jgi:hypothetical protein
MLHPVLLRLKAQPLALQLIHVTTTSARSSFNASTILCAGTIHRRLSASDSPENLSELRTKPAEIFRFCHSEATAKSSR